LGALPIHINLLTEVSTYFVITSSVQQIKAKGLLPWLMLVSYGSLALLNEWRTLITGRRPSMRQRT